MKFAKEIKSYSILGGWGKINQSIFVADTILKILPNQEVLMNRETERQREMGGRGKAYSEIRFTLQIKGSLQGLAEIAPAFSLCFNN